MSPFQQHAERLWQGREEVIPALEAYAEELSGRNVHRWEVRQLVRLLRSANSPNDLQVASSPQCATLACAAARSDEIATWLGSLMQCHFDQQAMQRGLARVLVYPALVLVASLALLVIFAFAIAPEFREMFAEFDLQLPASTAAVLALAELLTSIAWQWYPLVLFLLIVGCCWLCLRALRQRKNRFVVVEDFARSLADLMEAHTFKPDALRMASCVTTQPELRTAVERWADALARGEYPESVPGMPHSIVRALHRDDSAVVTADWLRMLAEGIHSTQDTRQRLIVGLVEPLAIVVVALVAGLVFLSLLLPLYSLLRNLS